ncbi:hypothetical protein [Streptomyces sp. NPDC007991]|uniref:hypothetical protein n=1 Tax=Streptomyces sp. NPDC007991 TaxID=3364803 RepID=UPI0036EE477E
MNQERRDLVVGLDAGGTRTRAVLATAEDGHPVGEGAAGPGNALTVPLPQLTEHLAEAIGRAVPEPVRHRVVAVAGGFAGAAGAADDEPGRRNALAALTAALHRLGIDAGPPVIGSDIEAAFASAPANPADGLALVAGTGAVAMRITDRRGTVTVDGDGWLLGDDGSGFWIGRAAVRAALRMADGRGAPTVLAETVGRELGVPADALPGGASGAVAGGAVRRLSPDVVPGTAEGTPRDGRQEDVPPGAGPSAGGGWSGGAGGMTGRPEGSVRSGGAGAVGGGSADPGHPGGAGAAGGGSAGSAQGGVAGGQGEAGVVGGQGQAGAGGRGQAGAAGGVGGGAAGPGEGGAVADVGGWPGDAGQTGVTGGPVGGLTGLEPTGVAGGQGESGVAGGTGGGAAGPGEGGAVADVGGWPGDAGQTGVTGGPVGGPTGLEPTGVAGGQGEPGVVAGQGQAGAAGGTGGGAAGSAQGGVAGGQRPTGAAGSPVRAGVVGVGGGPTGLAQARTAGGQGPAGAPGGPGPTAVAGGQGQAGGPGQVGVAGGVSGVVGSSGGRRSVVPPRDHIPWSRARREAYRRYLLPAVMAEAPIRLARLAPLVVAAARDAEDTVALAILDEAADQLTQSVRALEPRAGERVVATGGLLGPGGPLTDRLETRLGALGLTLDWVPDGCRGAVALARLAHGGRR